MFYSTFFIQCYYLSSTSRLVKIMKHFLPSVLYSFPCAYFPSLFLIFSLIFLNFYCSFSLSCFILIILCHTLCEFSWLIYLHLWVDEFVCIFFHRQSSWVLSNILEWNLKSNVMCKKLDKFISVQLSDCCVFWPTFECLHTQKLDEIFSAFLPHVCSFWWVARMLPTSH